MSKERTWKGLGGACNASTIGSRLSVLDRMSLVRFVNIAKKTRQSAGGAYF